MPKTNANANPISSRTELLSDFKTPAPTKATATATTTPESKLPPGQPSRAHLLPIELHRISTRSDDLPLSWLGPASGRRPTSTSLPTPSPRPNLSQRKT
ncbi:hypothetical protein CMUS01_14680 [Colletotrichum musicola]|uniref:Uncharacterized protein n=1 Tax=Colletotrichum musicola TaxID=2175873 RepID=A0A8H6J2V8_9PEZI|nr:hypothetical protein CMUS01_14680 [Colletotrichum musicola]